MDFMYVLEITDPEIKERIQRKGNKVKSLGGLGLQWLV